MEQNQNQPKKILIGIYQLDHIGGAELYTIDLLKELKKRANISVEYFAINRGRLAERVENELGIPYKSQDSYDLILATHNVTIEQVFQLGPTVQICHGAILELEQPSPLADFHIGITQEVCESLTQKGYPNNLILNGLDLAEKKPITTVNKTLKNVLSLCQSEEANDLLATVCKERDLHFKHFNKHKNPTFEIEKEINKADLVVGIGRSIYDAMACGRPCIVFDSRNYNGNKGDGYLAPKLFEQFITTNCSGRFNNFSFSTNELHREFDQYNWADGPKLREIAEKHLNIEYTTTQLLETLHIIPQNNSLRKKSYLLRRKFRTIRKYIKREIKALLAP